MNRPLTDRERCLQLEARVAQLEEELAAWRGHDADDDRDEADALRLDAVKRALVRSVPAKALNGQQALAARTLLLLLDRRGRLTTQAALAARISPTGDGELKVAQVAICRLRKALRHWKLADAVRTVWGQGYVLEPEAAERIERILAAASAPDVTEVRLARW